MEQPILKIGTHNGSFHCDDALACFLLKRLHPDAEIVRSRDPTVLTSCHYVVDVGAVFNHETKRYDHHQREFADSFHSLDPTKRWVTKLSSAGLVYFYYGRQIIKTVLFDQKENEIADNNSAVELIFDNVYENFVEEIDAVDNGIAAFDGQARYRITSTISRRIAHLNPGWNEKSDDDILLRQFLKAMEVVGGELIDKICFYAKQWLPARGIVRIAILNREEVHKSGEIVKFADVSAPWKDHLLDIEKELDIVNLIKYVLYEDSNGQWRVQCVPKSLDSFESRLPLPTEWRGLRDGILSAKSGINGCIFVHANGFIGGNQTFEGALEMAVNCLDSDPSQQKKLKLDDNN